MFHRYPNDRNSKEHDSLINVTIDGQNVQALEGDSVAAAALSNGLPYTRTTPVSGAPRAPFCLMGVCFDCLMVINGVPNQRACMTKVATGMEIRTQAGEGNIDE